MKKSLVLILWPLIGYGLATYAIPQLGFGDGEIHLLVTLTMVAGIITGGGALFIGISPLIAIPSLIAVGLIQFLMYRSAKSLFGFFVKWIGLVAGIMFVIHGVQKLMA